MFSYFLYKTMLEPYVSKETRTVPRRGEMSNHLFLFDNNLLTEYQKTFELFKQHGYTKLKCNQTTFNTMLTMLKKEYSFLYESESSTLQQVYRDLIRSFNGFFKKNSNYPKFKSKKIQKTDSEYKTIIISK